MPVISIDYKHQIKNETLEGGCAFLSESKLSKNKSMLVNVEKEEKKSHLGEKKRNLGKS